FGAPEPDTKPDPAKLAQALAFPASAPTTKTLRYRQDRVHDFAWFADKRYNVLQDTVRLPSGRTVQTMVLFINREPVRWIKGLEEVNTALRSYSRWVGEYPYSAVTAVDGALTAGSGMEYPMVTVTEPGAITHEVGHNWFYGILGSNERDFPWMDEGVNTYEHLRTEALSEPMAGLLPEMAGLGLTPKRLKTFGFEGLPAPAFNQLPYQMAAAHGADQPVQGPGSAEFTPFNYNGSVYFKTASLLRYLAGYLGQEKFDAAMRLYYARWQFRHPYPEDMQAVFEESTGQKLGWFFGDMLGGTHHYDADLSAVALFNDVVKVLVRTDSEVPWAVPVSSLDAQGNVLETLWTAPFGNLDANAEEDATSQLNFRRTGVASLVVDAGYLTPQLNRRNDRLKLEGSLARTEPLRLRPLLSIERWDRKTISWLPVAGANTSDKFMLGAAFYNNPLAPRPVQFLAMPMYSFNRNELNGIGRIQLNDLPHSKVRRFITSFTVQRFERYLKLEPAFTFLLPHRPGAAVQQQASLAFTSVHDQDRARTSSIYSLEYGAHHEDALNHWRAHVELNQLQAATNSTNSAFLLRAEASYLRYYSPRKRVQARLFGGRFLQGPAQSDFVLGLSGSPDYRRQTFFLDRQQISPTFAAQFHQTDGRDGAFKAFLPVASSSWLSTLNLQADLPITKLAVFADFGATGDTQYLAGRLQDQRLFYDAGLTVPFFQEILQFYVPVVGSQFRNGTPDSRQAFTDGIRFQIHFEKMNPFKLLDETLSK
ncbi:M1 family aminopeptidase, partial [Hymenobacter agri]